MPSRPYPQVVRAITDTTYTVVRGDYGSLITNRGGGALTVTLPAPAAGNAGAFVDFYQVAAGDFVLSCTDSIVLLNDAAASSLTIGTDNEEIGNGTMAFSDGTSWFLYRHQAAEAVTDVVGA